MNDRLDTAGFTLLETMIALAILGIALMGTLGGFITVDTQLKDAQLRQGKMVLLDAKVQRVLLTNKAELTGIPAVWTPDPTQSIVNANNTPTPRPVPDPDIDLSVGAYFLVLPNGEITQINLAAGTPCTSGLLPGGAYCREVMVTPGMPNGAALPSGGAWPGLNGVVAPQTYWIRVYRRGQNPSQAQVYQQVLIQ
jgi:prepilin-type N-terminal cleavage/methylation domain-containing protein